MWGPPGIGKSSLARAVLRALDPSSSVTCTIDVPSLVAREPSRVWRAVAERCAAAVRLPQEILPAVWSSMRSEMDNLRSVVERRVLRPAQPFVLVLVGVDALSQLPAGEDFYRLLRFLLERPARVGEGFHLVVTMCHSPNEIIVRVDSSPFNLVPPIMVRDLDEQQVAELVARSGGSWDVGDRRAAMGLVGGSPALLTTLLDRTKGAPLRSLAAQLSRESFVVETFGAHFDDLRLHLSRHPDQLRALNTLAWSSRAGDQATLFGLRAAGIVVSEGRGWRLRYPLYEHLLRLVP